MVNINSVLINSAAYLPLSGGTITGTLTYTAGTPAAGKLLTSDANGVASWEYLGSPTLDIPDDTIFVWGTDGDIASILRSTALNANTALTGVLVGTPVSQAIAANSFILSNITADGDFGFYANLGGHSQQWMFYDTSATQGFLRGSYTIGTGALPAPDSLLHVWAGSAGAVTALAGTVATFENSDDVAISLFAPLNKSASILIGNTDSAYSGVLKYYGRTATPSDTWAVFIAAVDRLHYSAGAFAFQEAITISALGGIQLAQGTATDQYLVAYGGTTAAGKGSQIAIFGSTHAVNPGNVLIITPNAAGSGNVTRLTISGMADTTGTVVWTNINAMTFDQAVTISTSGTGANGMKLKNLKNAAASALSGTQLDVEIDIGGTPYYFTCYPTKA